MRIVTVGYNIGRNCFTVYFKWKVVLVCHTFHMFAPTTIIFYMAVSLIILLGKEGKKLYFKETLEQPTGQSKMDNPETLFQLSIDKLKVS